MRFGSLIAAAAAAALLVNANAPPARAGLIDGGTNTVEASFWIPAFGLTTTSPPPPACDTTTNPTCENEVDSTDNATPTIPANFVAGPISELDDFGRRHPNRDHQSGHVSFLLDDASLFRSLRWVPVYLFERGRHHGSERRSGQRRRFSAERHGTSRWAPAIVANAHRR